VAIGASAEDSGVEMPAAAEARTWSETTDRQLDAVDAWMATTVQKTVKLTAKLQPKQVNQTTNWNNWL
jgi:mono/diheme cytochrome c family protein